MILKISEMRRDRDFLHKIKVDGLGLKPLLSTSFVICGAPWWSDSNQQFLRAKTFLDLAVTFLSFEIETCL